MGPISPTAYNMRKMRLELLLLKLTTGLLSQSIRDNRYIFFSNVFYSELLPAYERFSKRFENLCHHLFICEDDDKDTNIHPIKIIMYHRMVPWRALHEILLRCINVYSQTIFKT